MGRRSFAELASELGVEAGRELGFALRSLAHDCNSSLGTIGLELQMLRSGLGALEGDTSELVEGLDNLEHAYRKLQTLIRGVG